LLSVIDECLSEAEPHRRFAKLACVADAVSGGAASLGTPGKGAFTG
jgi:hypothetical protein